jgi:amino acid transporter
MRQLDEVLRRPELLATVLFSAFFIFIPNTDGNSLQFARHILLASNPTVTETTELDKRLISYVAVSILTVVSFIHYFSRNSGLLLNLVFAIYKVALVVVLIICGCIASKKSDNGWSDWGEQPVASKDVLAAMIYIIYSYQGWENANYVGGELKIESRALKWGAFLAVGVTTILYTLVVMAFVSCPKICSLSKAQLIFSSHSPSHVPSRNLPVKIWVLSAISLQKHLASRELKGSKFVSRFLRSEI